MNCPKCHEALLVGVTFCECGWREKGTGEAAKQANQEAYLERRAQQERRMDERLKALLKARDERK